MNDCFGRELKRGDLIAIACGGCHVIGIFLEVTSLSIRYYRVDDWYVSQFQAYLNGTRRLVPHVCYINSVYSGRMLIIPRETLPLATLTSYESIVRSMEILQFRKSFKKQKHD